MIISKEPLFKKQLLFLAAGLALILAVFFIGGRMAVHMYPQQQLIIIAGAGLLAISFPVMMLWKLWSHTIDRLEKLSLTFDRVMDGEQIDPVNSEGEGILSRLESQSCQMARRLQLGMETVNREKEDLKSLVTDISHQIKTPLASIKVFNSLLIEGGLNDREVHEFLEREKEQVEKLEWLSASLIKISQMETGIIQLKKETGDIKQTVLDAVNEVYSRALAKNVEIDIQSLNSVLVAHDCKWTREAIVNILENSIKYVPENGRIDISIELMETCIKIDIEDNGIGIPPDEIGQIFKRFFRGGNSLVKKSEGSGIGLYLTRMIIEEQDGAIVAASSPGHGARFSIILGR